MSDSSANQNAANNGATQTAILVAIGVVVVAGAGFASLSHDNAGQIIGLCTLAVVSLFSLLQQTRTSAQQAESAVKQEVAVTKVAEAAKVAATKVAEVKETLEQTTSATADKLDEMANVAHATHSLVNSAMAVQLKSNAELSRWKADQTGKKEHIAAAEAAEKLYQEHEAKQTKLDEAVAQQPAPLSQPEPHTVKVIVEGERLPPKSP